MAASENSRNGKIVFNLSMPEIAKANIALENLRQQLRREGQQVTRRAVTESLPPVNGRQ